MISKNQLPLDFLPSKAPCFPCTSFGEKPKYFILKFLNRKDFKKNSMKEEKKKINNRFLIGMTDMDLAKLKTEFLNSNINSFSKFCSSKLMDKYFLVNDKSFSKLFSELSKVGSNLNQISKSLNSVNCDYSNLDFNVLKELKSLISEIKEYQNFILNENL